MVSGTPPSPYVRHCPPSCASSSSYRRASGTSELSTLTQGSHRQVLSRQMPPALQVLSPGAAALQVPPIPIPPLPRQALSPLARIRGLLSRQVLSVTVLCCASRVLLPTTSMRWSGLRAKQHSFILPVAISKAGIQKESKYVNLSLARASGTIPRQVPPIPIPPPIPTYPDQVLSPLPRVRCLSCSRTSGTTSSCPDPIRSRTSGGSFLSSSKA